MKDDMLSKLLSYASTLAYNGEVDVVRSLEEVASAIGERSADVEEYFCHEESTYWEERYQGPHCTKFADYFADATGRWVQFIDITREPYVALHARV